MLNCAFPNAVMILSIRCGFNDFLVQGLVANETLGYYIGRIHLFMMKIGVDPLRIRFRQHLRNEMAHYACDCWYDDGDDEDFDDNGDDEDFNDGIVFGPPFAR